ncbi:MAG: hypothetical protein AB1491_05900 [Thermodesulfobacteriota bacterium]
MAKRRTIGESPLDAAVPGAPLDAVLAGVSPAPAADKPQPRKEEIPKEYRERLAALEKENAGLKAEVAELQARLKELQAHLKPAAAEPWWLTVLREKLKGK